MEGAPVADINKIPKGSAKPNVKFDDVQFTPEQKAFLKEKGISAHGVSMSFDPASPSGDHSAFGVVGPTGPKGPVGPPGPTGANGPDASNAVEAQQFLEEMGNHFKIPKHPDPSVHEAMVLSEIAKQHPALAQSLHIKAKLHQPNVQNANGDIFTEETLKKAFPGQVTFHTEQMTEEELEHIKELLQKHKSTKVMPVASSGKHEFGEISDLPSSKTFPDPFLEQSKLQKKILDSLPSEFPELPPLVGTPKDKPSQVEELWNASTTGRTSSEKPSVSNTGKPKHDIKMLEVRMDDEGNITTKAVEKESGGMAKLLAPQEYNADLVFETVRQVVQEIQDAREEQLLKKVSDVISDVVVAEREQWKRAYNAVTTEFHRFKTEAEGWSKEVAVKLGEMQVQMLDLSEQLAEAKQENARLERENSKLRVKGGLNRLPRKVITD